MRPDHHIFAKEPLSIRRASAHDLSRHPRELLGNAGLTDQLGQTTISGIDDPHLPHMTSQRPRDPIPAPTWKGNQAGVKSKVPECLLASL